jgi:hypothetical protein
MGLDDGYRIIGSTRNRPNDSAVKIKAANQALTVMSLVESFTPGKRTLGAGTDEAEAVVPLTAVRGSANGVRGAENRRSPVGLEEMLRWVLQSSLLSIPIKRPRPFRRVVPLYP